MSTYRYYLGPWRWQRSPMPSWNAPPGTVGAIDLATLAEQSVPGTSGGSLRRNGFFASTEILPSEYAFLGQGDVREIASTALIKAAWRSVAGHQPQGDRLLDLLWDHLTSGADPEGDSACKPLVPGRTLWMDLHLGGHGKLRGERIEWGRPGSRGTNHAPKLKAMLRAQFQRLFDDAQAGRLSDRQHHRRVLDYWCEQYGVTDWKEFVPAALQAHVPGRLRHRTTITESFNKADSTTLGPDLTWTELAGDWEVVSNAATKVTSSNPRDLARADSDLSSDDHYAQAKLVSNAADDFHGPVARIPNTADNTGYIAANFGGVHYLQKLVMFTATNLASTSYTLVANDVFKVKADGSTISTEINAAPTLSATDTAITGNLRCGLHMFGASSSPHLDEFQAADLAAAGTNYVQLERSTRGLLRGVYTRYGA